MEHRVNSKYMAERQGGPRRAVVASIAAIGSVAAFSLVEGGASAIPVLAIAACVMGVSMSFALSKMKKMTRQLEQTTYTIEADGIKVITSDRSVTIPAAEISKISFVRPIFSRGFVYFEIVTRRGPLATAPLEDAEAFAAQLCAAIPAVTLRRKRSLFAPQ